MIFTVLILLLLWLFLFVFLEGYYQSMKTKDITKSVQVIQNTYGRDDFPEILQNIAFDNTMCVEITDKYGNELYSYEMMAERCLIHREHGVLLYGLQNKLLDSETGQIFYSVKDKKYGTKMLVYGMIIGDKNNIEAFVYLNTMLEPIESSTAIIKKQLFYITFIILALAIIITLFISKKLSRPIVKITKSANKFA